MKSWIRCAGSRAIRTVCQTAVAAIGTSYVLSEVDMRMIVSASILSGIVSLLTSAATGMPEFTTEEESKSEE